MAIETPGSNGAFGPTLEIASTTFPHAPRLTTVEAARADTEPSTVTVRYKLSEVSVSFSCVRKLLCNGNCFEPQIYQMRHLKWITPNVLGIPQLLQASEAHGISTTNGEAFVFRQQIFHQVTCACAAVVRSQLENNRLETESERSQVFLEEKEITTNRPIGRLVHQMVSFSSSFPHTMILAWRDTRQPRRKSRPPPRFDRGHDRKPARGQLLARGGRVGGP